MNILYHCIIFQISCFNRKKKYETIFNCYECFKEEVINKKIQTSNIITRSLNTKIKLDQRIMNVLENIFKFHLKDIETQKTHYIDGSITEIKTTSENIFSKLYDVIQNKMACLNAAHFGESTNIGIFIDGNNIILDDFVSDNQLVRKTLDDKKYLIEHIQKNIPKNVLEKIDLIDAKDSRGYFSKEYATLIYIFTGITNIHHNINRNNNSYNEYFRIDPYFGFSRSTHDLTIIYGVDNCRSKLKNLIL